MLSQVPSAWARSIPHFRRDEVVLKHEAGIDPSALQGPRARLAAKMKPYELQDRHAHKQRRSTTALLGGGGGGGGGAGAGPLSIQTDSAQSGPHLLSRGASSPFGIFKTF